MNVILTGSHGFIAQAIEKKLKEYEFKVIPMPRQCFYRVVELSEFFAKNPPDYIIHTASYGNLYSQQDEMQIMYANVYALFNLLEIAKNIPYQGFINFSTSSVLLPYQTMYSASKAAGELLINAFVQKYDKPVVSVRPYSVIGIGEQAEHLIPTLIRSAQNGLDMPFVDEPVHDFIDVEDVADFILKLMEFTNVLGGKAIGIGTGIQTSNKEVKELVEKITGKQIKTHAVEQIRPYDTTNWKADTTILDTLKWKPQFTLEETIRKMI